MTMEKWETHEIRGPFYPCDNECEHTYFANEIVWYEGTNYDGEHVEGFLCDECAQEHGCWDDEHDGFDESGPTLSQELQRRMEKDKSDE